MATSESRFIFSCILYFPRTYLSSYSPNTQVLMTKFQYLVICAGTRAWELLVCWSIKSWRIASPRSGILHCKNGDGVPAMFPWCCWCWRIAIIYKRSMRASQVHHAMLCNVIHSTLKVTQQKPLVYIANCPSDNKSGTEMVTVLKDSRFTIYTPADNCCPEIHVAAGQKLFRS